MTYIFCRLYRVRQAPYFRGMGVYPIPPTLTLDELDSLVDDLERDEGYRGYLYDDARPNLPIDLRPLFKGQPTIGIGLCLKFPWPREEARAACAARCARNDLYYAKMDWYSVLSFPQKKAILNLAYHRGPGWIVQLRGFCDALRARDFNTAVKVLMASDEARFSTRIKHLVSLILPEPPKDSPH